MAFAASTDPPRDRAVSSEPCTTRPNPFDDGDLASRKRRRTSLNSDSRSVSVETLDTFPSPPATGKLVAAEFRPSLAMKVDSETTIPATPKEQKQSAQQDTAQQEPQPAPCARPSDSDPQQKASAQLPKSAISLPPSPSPETAVPPAASTTTTDVAQIVMEGQKAVVPAETRVVDASAQTTGAQSGSESASPPVEVVSVNTTDDDDDGDGFETDESVTLLDGVSLINDPSADFPYHEPSESPLETIIRLTAYIPTHPQVALGFAEWIDKYLGYVHAVSFRAAADSYLVHKEIWQCIPELVIFLVSRKAPYPRNRDLRQAIFSFYRAFAKLAAHFVQFDVRLLRSASVPEQQRIQYLASQQYVQALAMLSTREEIALHASTPASAERDWSYSAEVTVILDLFQRHSEVQGGSLAAVRELAQLQCEYASQYPRLTDHIGSLCLLMANMLRMFAHNQALPDRVTILSRCYTLFRTVSAMVGNIIEKNLNHLTQEGAANILNSLAEIYELCLSVGGVVPAEILKEYRQVQPPIPVYHAAEAIAHHWKFTHFVRLIKSGQMQLRVMAVSNMCNDLITIYNKYQETFGDEATDAYTHFIANFLIETGLVNYILGPTCHPEITIESSNIIGFLLVSNTYTKEHTDALWQTVTTTQDPRVSDALMRMTSRITQLYSRDGLLYLCDKLNTVPVESFGPTMREFCDAVIRTIISRNPDCLVSDARPFNLFIRLVRQASVFGAQSPVAYPEVQQFAIHKLDSLMNHGPGLEGRWTIYADCLADIEKKSPTTMGSLWVLKLATRNYHGQDLHDLITTHDLTRLLIDEFESAIAVAKNTNFPAVLSGGQNVPRRDLLSILIHQEAHAMPQGQAHPIAGEHGLRLWNMLVGSKAACKEDRDAAWQMLNSAMKQSHGRNPFTATCFSEYLPNLEPEFFCQGTLEFVCEAVLPLVNDPTSIILDDEDNPHHPMLELLWRMALAAPTGTIEAKAIHTLVNDVYIESRSIHSFPHYRARKVHLALVERCVRQLSSAAARLRAFAEGAVSSGEGDNMVIVPSEQQLREQELLFIRSLAILREFHRLHQGKPQFSVPDMRALIPETPKDIEGEPAGLKFQSFDGEKHTDVMPLNIGKRNTAASLLASLRQATGFESYRMYYRGRPFVPSESDICKSLEDLQIHNGIILVKKEPAPPTPAKPRSGASPIEAEILSHFDEFWEYLSMEESLAREIYGFLIKLPVDEKALEVIDDPSRSYLDLFPLGQPFKSLYAIYALQQYLKAPRKSGAVGNTDLTANETVQSRADGIIRVMSVLVPAISDPQVCGLCPTRELQIELGSAMMKLLLLLVKDSDLPSSATRLLDAPLLNRLVDLLAETLTASNTNNATQHVMLCLQTILESCPISAEFADAFCAHPDVPRLLEDLLLNDPRDVVRRSTAVFIRNACKLGDEELAAPDIPAAKFRNFFWPVVSRLVTPAISKPEKSTEVLNLCFDMLQALRASQSEVVQIRQLAQEWFALLMNYTTFEDATKPEVVDEVAFGLIRIIHDTILAAETRQEVLPPPGVARKIFWKHLFPPQADSEEYDSCRPIVSQQTRAMLLDIVFSSVEHDHRQYLWLLEDMASLVPMYPNQDELYSYELPQQFEREKALRGSCGYPGLRNLSNTCYFNSLFTQLFMNVDFRRFMLSATVRDPEGSQHLLYQTQRLFAYMQNTLRRYVNPEECISSVKTYDDTQIDPNIQMDVDEFYNLLCDRWEGQFATGEEKSQFRSIYGGQLVQQVRSQECEHISERLEPFLAIQCDIKGKSTLEESLQAYVDGEIMEGDNKYKCSTCDKHVDAVKRVCLKDVPDHLIFHLKRFEWNLRTMTRSKINDMFTFPNRINMRPYTIDHLSSPDDDKEEDIFELVGILVHSGTAESGHYYSYIRERPTNGNAETWVEFNDDVVTPWDPSSMATACFGGPEYNAQFQQGNTVYDKQYSAYMLFYQRSSSLSKSQELLQSTGALAPLTVSVPPHLRDVIREENNWLLRRHCLFDPTQIPFACVLLLHLKNMGGPHGGCSEDHRLETQALHMALGHLDQVASRTKETPDFLRLLGQIRIMALQCARCSLAVFRFFVDYPDALRMLVQRNVDAEVRQNSVSFIIQVLQTIKKLAPRQYIGAEGMEEESSVISGMIGILEQLFGCFQVNLRSWNEVFDLMLEFVKLGPDELAAFLEHPLFLRSLLLIVVADGLEGPLPAQFLKMLNNISRRPPARPPAYESILSLLDVLLSRIRLLYTDSGYPIGAANTRERVLKNPDFANHPFDVTKGETDILHMASRSQPVNIFVDRLIAINQNHEATDSILANLIRQSPRMEDMIMRTLATRSVGHIAQLNVTPYLRVAGSVFLREAQNASRVTTLMQQVSRECWFLQNAEGKAFLDFVRDTFEGPRPRCKQGVEQVYSLALEFVPQWAPGLLGYFDMDVVEETEQLLQEKIFQYRTFRPQPPPSKEEEEGAQDQAQPQDEIVRLLGDKMRLTARSLGFRCLLYLRDNYVQKNAEVTERAVAGLQRTIKHCSRYFNLKEPGEDPDAQKFMETNNSEWPLTYY